MLKMLKKMALFPLAMEGPAESLPFNIDGFPNTGRLTCQAKGENGSMYDVTQSFSDAILGCHP